MYLEFTNRQAERSQHETGKVVGLGNTRIFLDKVKRNAKESDRTVTLVVAQKSTATAGSRIQAGLRLVSK